MFLFYITAQTLVLNGTNGIKLNLQTVCYAHPDSMYLKQIS